MGVRGGDDMGGGGGGGGIVVVERDDTERDEEDFGVIVAYRAEDALVSCGCHFPIN